MKDKGKKYRCKKEVLVGCLSRVKRLMRYLKEMDRNISIVKRFK